MGPRADHGRIGGLDRPDLYIRKMMLNEYLSWRRRSARQIPAGDATLERASAALDHAQQFIEREALLAELGKLSRRQRAVLVLRYYEDRDDAGDRVPLPLRHVETTDEIEFRCTQHFRQRSPVHDKVVREPFPPSGPMHRAQLESRRTHWNL